MTGILQQSFLLRLPPRPQAGEVKEPGLKGHQSVSALTPLKRQDPDLPLGQGPANTASSSQGNKVK